MELKQGDNVEIAGKLHTVYNVMTGLGLVGFAKVGKNGRLLASNITMSYEQIEKFYLLGVIRKS